jgi:hypothetical protein
VARIWVAPVVWVKDPVSGPPPKLLASLPLPRAEVVKVVCTPALVVTFTVVWALALAFMVWLDCTFKLPLTTALVTLLPVALVVAVVESETSTTFRVWVEKTSPS